MNRNETVNLSNYPQIKMPRSKFPGLSRTKTTSFGIGRLVPIYTEEILPEDSIKLSTRQVVRLKNSFIKPVMDQLFLDTFYFFVPNRLVWEHWKEFMGENPTTPFTQPTNYQIPQTIIPNTQFVGPGTILDYLGIPPIKPTNSISISSLWYRAYMLIWNEYFRNQNTQNSLPFVKDDSNITANSTNMQSTGNMYCWPVNRIGDFFSKALPEPQKGDAIKIPVGTTADVMGDNNLTRITGYDIANNTNKSYTTQATSTGQVYTTNSQAISGEYDTNLNATINVGTINDLIEAYAIQKLLWHQSIGGTRYTEILETSFGVRTSDARLQRPEFLGSANLDITTFQVAQNSSTNETSAQANLAAFGQGQQGDEFIFDKTFEEHGMILGFAVVRYQHSYQQGLHKKFSRKTKYEFYWPELANLGDMPIYNKELLLKGNTTTDEEVFGYQGAWEEYKQSYNEVTGFMRTKSETITDEYPSDDIYHYADWYGQFTPSLATISSEQSAYQNFDRTMAVETSAYDGIMLQIKFDIEATRVMPTNAIPGFESWN